ncbi:MAG: single-stranded-DNA-specific exonuclease RecJ [Catonella sp.]|uniref:single-stranded-DNA-specific exonuclease RecJ n=1 Tax=Catonella sp. TaxID=2382125 RepID=UPI003FA0A879
MERKSVMRGRWFIKNIDGDFDGIAERFGVEKMVARVLVNRGLNTDEEIFEYLNAEKGELADPALMYDLEKACEIINEKIEAGKKIRIIGDYDVDGVCSTFILYDYFRKIGADISYVIPHRVQDGYGINIDIVDKAKADGVDTVITCDNGIAAYEQVKHAKEIGLTVIITDHHDIPINNELPPADTVTDPKREDCNYPFKGLCGAGVAYQLINCYAKKYGKDVGVLKQTIEKTYLEFVALATVCDVMELVRENRIIVKKGLKAIYNTENIGLRAMLEVSGLAEKEGISVYHIGFILGPMINASGRLESAVKAIKLFLEDDKDKALEEARELQELNNERKSITEQSLIKATEIAESPEYINDKVLVILVPDCHESIAGIVAGKIKERFYKPTLIFTYAERGIKGSGRSIEDYNMFEEISKCAECFSKFGGHPMAAGFSLKGENTAEQLEVFSALRRKLNENVKLTEEELRPKIYFDMELPPYYVSESLINNLAKLAPYGNGNKAPTFARRNMFVSTYRILGKNENVMKLELADEEDGQLYNAIWYGDAKAFEQYLLSKDEKKLSVIYSPEINEYRGVKKIQLKIEEYR